LKCTSTHRNALIARFHLTKMGKVVLVTEDKVNISAIYTKLNTKQAIILVHMLNRKKEDWNPFVQQAHMKNIATLAFDLRGHGENEGTNWQQFSDKDFQKMVWDIKAAKAYLEQPEQGHTEIMLIGASIGANSVLRYAVSDPSIQKIILLSPGENYHGVKILDIAKEYTGEMLVISSKDDPMSFGASQELAKKAAHAETIFYAEGGHGTHLLMAKKELQEKVLAFLKKQG